MAAELISVERRTRRGRPPRPAHSASASSRTARIAVLRGQCLEVLDPSSASGRPAGFSRKACVLCHPAPCRAASSRNSGGLQSRSRPRARPHGVDRRFDRREVRDVLHLAMSARGRGEPISPRPSARAGRCWSTDESCQTPTTPILMWLGPRPSPSVDMMMTASPVRTLAPGKLGARHALTPKGQPQLSSTCSASLSPARKGRDWLPSRGEGSSDVRGQPVVGVVGCWPLRSPMQKSQISITSKTVAPSAPTREASVHRPKKLVPVGPPTRRPSQRDSARMAASTPRRARAACGRSPWG